MRVQEKPLRFAEALVGLQGCVFQIRKTCCFLPVNIFSLPRHPQYEGSLKYSVINTLDDSSHRCLLEGCWAACEGTFCTYRDWLPLLDNDLYLNIFLLKWFWTLNSVTQFHHSHYLLNLAWNNSQLFLWVRFTPKGWLFIVISSYLHLFIYKHVSIISIGSDGPISQEHVLFWESVESVDTSNTIWKVL